MDHKTLSEQLENDLEKSIADLEDINIDFSDIDLTNLDDIDIEPLEDIGLDLDLTDINIDLGLDDIELDLTDIESPIDAFKIEI